MDAFSNDPNKIIGEGLVQEINLLDVSLTISVSSGKPPEDGNVLYYYRDNPWQEHFHGIPDWIPIQSDAHDSLVVVNGSGQQITREGYSLQGVHYDGSHDHNVQESIQNALGYQTLLGDYKKPTLFMNPIDAQDYTPPMHGLDDFILSPYVPQGFAWLLDMSTWKLVYLSDVELERRVYTTEIYATHAIYQQMPQDSGMRYGWIAELLCTSPANNTVITLSRI